MLLSPMYAIRFLNPMQVLVTASDLASHVNDSTLSSAWAANATALKQRFNDVFWLRLCTMSDLGARICLTSIGVVADEG